MGGNRQVADKRLYVRVPAGYVNTRSSGYSSMHLLSSVCPLQYSGQLSPDKSSIFDAPRPQEYLFFCCPTGGQL